MRNSGGGPPAIRLLGLLGICLMTATCGPAPTAVPGSAKKPAPPLPTPVLLEPDRAAERRLFSTAALHPFFATLLRLEKKQSEKPVRVLQIGDSHTAGDAFSGRMREAFQDRFGGAGRGWLPAGVPFKFYNPRLVTVTATGWRYLGPSSAAAEELGLDAVIAESEQPGAAMTLSSSETEGFDRFAVEYLAQPAGGDLAIRVDHRPSIRVSTAAPRIGVARAEIAMSAAGHEVEIAADPGPVRLVGWAVERRKPGVIYENHGTIGAKAGLLGRMSPDAVARELADSRPALLILAFGTNEGFEERLDPHRYAAEFRRHVGALQRLAPQAAILVLGPPDGNRIEPSCPREARDGCVSGAAAADLCTWREPPNLAVVRRIQKKIAAQQRWAFWDWSQAMGGACSIHRLFLLDPPWAFPDHVHLTRLGYDATADVLFFDLINAYERWKASQPAR